MAANKVPPQQLTTEDDLTLLMTVTEPDEAAYEDWVDEETGEVLWCANERADECRLHPVFVARQADELRARSEWTTKLLDDPLGLLNELIDAYVKEHADADACRDLGIGPNDVEMFYDLAESFFFSETRWREVLDYVDDEFYDEPLNKAFVQRMVAEQLHSALADQLRY